MNSRDEEDLLDAENLIQEVDSGSDAEQDELDELIKAEHQKFKLLVAESHRSGLRARSAPAIGSPSSAKQRKRSAERAKASHMRVEYSAPRQEYRPAHPEERFSLSRLGENSMKDAEAFPDEPDTPKSDRPEHHRLATVAEEQGALQGGGDGTGNPPSHASWASDDRDPYDAALALLDRDLQEPGSQARQPECHSGHAPRPCSAGAATQSHRKASRGSRCAIRSQGMLGLRVPRQPSASPIPSQTPPVPELAHSMCSPVAGGASFSRHPSPKGRRRPMSAPLRQQTREASPRNRRSTCGCGWGDPEDWNLPPPLQVGEEHVGDLPTRGFQPCGWNEDGARKVRDKVQEANSHSAKLGLSSTFRLVRSRRVGADNSVAVQVKSGTEKERCDKVISIQSFLNTHNRLCKLAALKDAPARRAKRSSPAKPLLTALSPAGRNQVPARLPRGQPSPLPQGEKRDGMDPQFPFHESGGREAAGRGPWAEVGVRGGLGVEGRSRCRQRFAG